MEYAKPRKHHNKEGATLLKSRERSTRSGFGLFGQGGLLGQHFGPQMGMLMSILVVLVFASTGCERGNKAWTGAYTPGDTVEDVGYQPDQEIKEFSHALHAGDKKIPCQYCHSGARRSAVAGIPPMNTCMGCHKLVAVDKDPIKYLKEKYDAKDPIRWTKVHDMPDFVRFSHQPHVQAGVDCATCHGDMTKVTTAKQVAPLQMSWCVDCHINNNASVSCQTCHY